MNSHSTTAILLLLSLVVFPASIPLVLVNGSSGASVSQSSMVIGEVKQIDSKLEGAVISSRVTISVIEVKNGSDNLKGKEIVVKYIGGAVGNLILLQSDQPTFCVGEIVEVQLRQEGNLFTVVGGFDGKTSLDNRLESITAETTAGYKLYWYKSGSGVAQATARPGSDWYGPLKWDSSDMPVNYWIDTRNIPADITESSFIEFARRSYQTWQDDATSNIELTYMGTRTDREWGISDGINIICWRSIDGNGGTLGVTRSYFGYIPGTYDSLRMVDGDIELDTGDSWSASDVPSPTRIDVQTVATHEAGHVVGMADLYDSEDSAMTMFGYTAPGDIRQRTLEWGDQAGLSVLYPSGVTNQRPTAYIDSIAPSPATQGQAVTFSGHGVDSDGSVTVYDWRSSLDGLLSSSASFATSGLSVGVHTVYFKVQDNQGAWSTEDTRTLTINAPTIEFDFSLTDSGGIGVTQGGSGSNTITVNLVGGTAQAVTLSASGLPTDAVAAFSPSSGNPSFTSILTVGTSPTTPTGSFEITVIGSGDGKTRASQFTLTVNAAGPSTITVYSLPISYLGQDPELAKSADIRSSIKADYVSSGLSKSNTYSTQFSIAADVGSTIILTVVSAPSGWSFANKWDWYGRMQYGEAVVTIQAPIGSSKVVAFFNSVNQVPTAYIDSISPNPSTQGESILFSGHGNDPDGSIAGYEWRSSIDGVLSTSSSFSTSSLSTGTHTISFRVQDNAGEWSTDDTRTVTVNSPPPTATFRIYSLPTSALGREPESAKANDLGASMRVDYVYQGQIQSRASNTPFDVIVDASSTVTFVVTSAPSGWSFANKWDWYGRTQYDTIVLTVTASTGSNEVAAYFTSSTPQTVVSIRPSATTVNIKQGGQVSITVSTTPAAQDLDVAVEVSQDNQQYTTWATGRTGSDGKFTSTLSFTTQGIYYIRAKWNEGTTTAITITAMETPCIIATVAYGGPASPPVVYMRHVRDDLIGSSRTGQALVEGWNRFYYSWSPTLAATASRSESLRCLLRLFLSPLNGIIHITADVFSTLAPINLDLASLTAFLLAAILSTSVYIVAPTSLIILLIGLAKKRVSHRNKF